MKNKRRNKVMLLVVLLLVLSIGFAALSTTLKINGTANIGKNSWNIYWDNVANKTGVTPVSGPTIGNDSQGGVNTQVTFEVNLNEPGDFYEFTVDAVNAGTLDAMITGIAETLNGNPVTSQNKLPDYIKFDVTYADGIEIGQYHLLPKATVSGNTTTPTVETYKVRIEYDRDKVDSSNLPASDTTYTLTYSITYAQADERAIPKPIKVWTLPQGKTRDTLSVGDEICAQDQCFNFIRYDGNDVVMLAKYNLNVGPNAKDYETFMQDSDIDGLTYGSVPFAAINYWILNPGTSNPSINPDYSKNNTIYFDKNAHYFRKQSDNSRVYIDVYDNTYIGYPATPYNPDDYSIAYYVEEYKSILEYDYNADIKEARLLYYDELAAAGITPTGNMYPKTGPTGFISNVSFWFGSATDDEYLYVISSNGMEGNYGLWDGSEPGVRPVIVVEKANL